MYVHVCTIFYSYFSKKQHILYFYYSNVSMYKIRRTVIELIFEIRTDEWEKKHQKNVYQLRNTIVSI